LLLLIPEEQNASRSNQFKRQHALALIEVGSWQQQYPSVVRYRDAGS
jgi:hypothetical protein